MLQIKSKEQMQEQKKQEKVNRYQQEQQQEQQPEHETTNSSPDATQKTGLLILEALEEVAKTVRASSTKQDINSILDRVQDIADKQQHVQRGMNELREHIRVEVNSMMENCTFILVYIIVFF